MSIVRQRCIAGMAVKLDSSGLWITPVKPRGHVKVLPVSVKFDALSGGMVFMVDLFNGSFALKMIRVVVVGSINSVVKRIWASPQMPQEQKKSNPRPFYVNPLDYCLGISHLYIPGVASKLVVRSV